MIFGKKFDTFFIQPRSCLLQDGYICSAPHFPLLEALELAEEHEPAPAPTAVLSLGATRPHKHVCIYTYV